MDCIHTQEILSQAADRAPVDAEILQQAKMHCSECAECSRFVRALTRLHKAPKPRMAPDALEALVKRARLEAERFEVSLAHEQALSIDDNTESGPEAAALAALAALKTREAAERPKSMWSKLSEIPMRQQAIIGSAVAAAIIVVGIVSVAGMSYLLTPTGTQTASLDEVSDESMTRGVDLQEESGAAEQAPSIVPDGTEFDYLADSGTPVSSFVMFDGWVYSSGRQQDVNLADLEITGDLRSDLGTEQDQSRPVWSSGDPLVIYVQSDSGELLGFDMETRRFEGVRFGLQSGDIPLFGQLPTLPAGIPDPINEDGSPTFASAGVDDGGVQMYPLIGTDPSQGYAIAPYTTGVNVSEGNPNWTWWMPAPTE
ncbi:MAG: hypothetical protein PF636_11130 [Actinomycetota bacterium]|jgi:hypothetical protein|nr:hypothetical protein [Actinomycetota bacterium]